MDNFLDRYKTPKLIWDQRDHLTNPTTHKEIEVVIEILPNKNNNKKKIPGPDCISVEFYPTFKE